MKGLLLSGETGRGKSRALWALARSLAEEGHRVTILPAADWFARLQEQVNYGRDDASAFVRAFARLPLLMLDDLGQEAVLAARADWAQAHFMSLLEMRLGYGLPIFATTNLTATELAGVQKSAVRAHPLIRRLLDLAEPVKF